MISGRWREAVDQYRLAIKMKPNDVGYVMTLACLLCKVDRVEEARAEFGKAMGLDDNPSIPRLAVDALRQNGHFQEALDVCAKALKANPDDEELIMQKDLIMEEM